MEDWEIFWGMDAFGYLFSGFPSTPPIIGAWEFFRLFFYYLDLRSLVFLVSINGGFLLLVDCLFPTTETPTQTTSQHDANKPHLDFREANSSFFLSTTFFFCKIGAMGRGSS